MLCEQRPRPTCGDWMKQAATVPVALLAAAVVLGAQGTVTGRRAAAVRRGTPAQAPTDGIASAQSTDRSRRSPDESSPPATGRSAVESRTGRDGSPPPGSSLVLKRPGETYT